MNIFLFLIIILGTIISLMNFYISFLAKKKLGSGIPLLGSLFLCFSLYYIKNKFIFYTISLIAFLDTGGIHWFIIFMLWQKIKTME